MHIDNDRLKEFNPCWKEQREFDEAIEEFTLASDKIHEEYLKIYQSLSPAKQEKMMRDPNGDSKDLKNQLRGAYQRVWKAQVALAGCKFTNPSIYSKPKSISSQALD